MVTKKELEQDGSLEQEESLAQDESSEQDESLVQDESSEQDDSQEQSLTQDFPEQEESLDQKDPEEKKAEHYYTSNPASEIREEEISFRVRNYPLKATGASGLFSKERLDKATALLLEYCEVEGCKNVLDLGCGWGAIILSLATFPKAFGLATDCDIIGVDSNSRAVMYTKKNLREHSSKRSKVYAELTMFVRQSEGFSKIPDKMFDAILTNPPYAAGRKVCFSFIDDSKEHLTKGGSLQLVARHNKGGKTLSLRMEEVFGNVEALAKKGGFRVYKSVKE